ncbi:MAG TPA: TIM barrel protein [Bryobacteraceae bacterium]|jgi:inosose dehydratase
MTRREWLLFTAAGMVSSAAGQSSRMSAEGYIFQQYAERQKKSLADVIDGIFPMAQHAGFHNVELNPVFFAPELRDRVLSALRSNNLSMPSVYVGGGMHEKALAEETTKHVLEIGALCKPFGCAAIVNNADPKPGHAAKTDAELAFQAEAMNRMGRLLRENGFQLRIHNHTPEMVDNAREWRYILRNTDPQFVTFCVDIDWVHQGGLDPLALLREAGKRVTEIHVRNSKDKLWLESVEDGDVDYRKVAELLNREDVRPLVVVELAYRDSSVVTRPLGEDLRLSRIYTEKIFGVRA